MDDKAGLVATFCVAVWCLYLVRANFFKVRRLPFPPGPTTSWFGRVKLPQTYQWLTYAKWGEVYGASLSPNIRWFRLLLVCTPAFHLFTGDVIYIYVFGNPILVLNSAEAVNDLLERRSGNYSSRPVRTMINELCGFSTLCCIVLR